MVSLLFDRHFCSHFSSIFRSIPPITNGIHKCGREHSPLGSIASVKPSCRHPPHEIEMYPHLKCQTVLLEQEGSLKFIMASPFKSFNILWAAVFCISTELPGEWELMKIPDDVFIEAAGLGRRRVLPSEWPPCLCNFLYSSSSLGTRA